MVAVVCHAYRAIVGNGAQFSHGCKARRAFVQLGAADDIGIAAHHRHAPDRSSADHSNPLQTRCALQERWLFAAFCHDLREQVDQPIVGSVDAAGDAG